MGSHTVTRPAEGVLLEFEFPIRSNTARAASLLWLAPDGSERLYALIEAGSDNEIVHTQGTYEGDTWRVRSAADSSLLLEHTATRASNQRLVIREDGADAARECANKAFEPIRQTPAAGEDAEDEDLQRALALSLLVHTSPGAAAAASTAAAAQNPSAARSVQDDAAPSNAQPPVAHPVLEPAKQRALPLDDALALSVQLAAQHDARARVQAQLSSAGDSPGTGPEAEARLQVRFADLNCSVLALRLAQSQTIQPLLDEILAHADGAEAAGAAPDARQAELRIASRTPELAFVVARSGLVRSAQPFGAHLLTVGELGLLPSAAFVVTVAVASQ